MDKFPIDDLAAMLLTLLEIQSGPASAFYLAFNSDIQRYNRVRAIAEQLGLISGTAEEINITEKGRQAAERAKSIFKAGQSV